MSSHIQDSHESSGVNRPKSLRQERSFFPRAYPTKRKSLDLFGQRNQVISRAEPSLCGFGALKPNPPVGKGEKTGDPEDMSGPAPL
jgi:hypothetical protein